MSDSKDTTGDSGGDIELDRPEQRASGPEEFGDDSTAETATSGGTTEVLAAPGEAEANRTKYVWVAVAVVVVFGLIGYWAYQRYTAPDEVGAEAPAPIATAESVRLVPEGPLPVEVPPLDQSDPLVRELLEQLSAHPQLLAWLATDELVRNFVVVTLNLANGESPVMQLRALEPTGKFLARTGDGRFFVDPASYARYNPHADAVASVDAKGLAGVYATLEPRITEAYRELGVEGNDGDDFTAVLERAFVELLRVPVVEGDIPLDEDTLSYEYTDPQLESLSPAQKHLLRMGPRNMRLVQAKLREVALYLGIPEARLPKSSFINVGAGR